MPYFWSDKNMEPKRKFRWTLSFGAGANLIDAYVLKKCTRPNFTQTETEHNFMNHTFYYPGRIKWETITVVLADAIDPNGAERIFNMVKDAGYVLPEAPNVYRTVSKASSVDALNSITITQRAADGSPLEIWTLKNPWIKDVKFNELDYSADDIMDIELTVRYDFAKLTQLNTLLKTT